MVGFGVRLEVWKCREEVCERVRTTKGLWIITVSYCDLEVAVGRMGGRYGNDGGFALELLWFCLGGMERGGICCCKLIAGCCGDRTLGCSVSESKCEMN